MIIDYPKPEQEQALRSLWREAFGDEEAFLDRFYTDGFAPDRCRCACIDGELAGALYWFDCSHQGKPLAYLYGVATAKAFRGKGVCRELMQNTHSLLKQLGYAGVILVPAEENLFSMYEKMGYTVCSYIASFSAVAGETATALRRLDVAEFCRLRAGMLPVDGVLQEGDGAHFLSTGADFYAGEDFLVTVAREEDFFPELLGNSTAAPQILAALGRKTGRFRTPGTEKAFAMFYPLADVPPPAYFGLAFD